MVQRHNAENTSAWKVPTVIACTQPMLESMESIALIESIDINTARVYYTDTH